jgi:hydroxypyruvate isomerase
MRAIAATGYDGYVGQEFTPVKDASISLELAYRICDV